MPHYPLYDIPPPPYSVAPSPRIDPVAFFPSEIISAIFVLACEPQIAHRDGQWPRACYPHRLGQVSRAWRQEAWGTSELWTTIVLPLGRATSLVGADKLLQEWIARAKEQLLNIWIQLPWRSGTQDRQRIMFRILMILRKCAHRWRTMEMWMTPAFVEMFDRTDFVNPFSSGLTFKHLESLSFRTRGLESLHTDWGLNFRNAPKLRELSLGMTVERNNKVLQDGFRVPAGQIKRLTCYQCPRLQLYTILNDFHALEELVITDLGVQWDPDSYDIQTHQRLKRITVTIADSKDDTTVFPHFVIVPSLSSISIRSSSKVNYEGMLTGFLLNSQAALTHLHLESVEFEIWDLVDTLVLMPTLTHLRIRIVEQAGIDYGKPVLSQEFFQHLNPDRNGLSLPHLEEFEYQGNLAVSGIEFLEPFIVRSRGRLSRIAVDNEVALLRKVNIKANQCGSCKLSVAEYPDPQLIWEVMSMIDSGKLTLVNGNGEPWS